MKVPLHKVTTGRVLTDWVTASLREAILNGHFEPGERLDQDHIAKEFEISRTPVREAVIRLVSKGLITHRSHHRAFVATVSQEDVREIYEIRSVLEGENIRQVTSLIPESVLDDLERSLSEAKERFEAGDIGGIRENASKNRSHPRFCRSTKPGQNHRR